jgi:phosphate transport system substrate-binding protein
VLISLVEPAAFSRFVNRAAPLDCATGELTLTGSTAFRPVLELAAGSYKNTCPDADFTFATNGSLNGLRTLNDAGQKLPTGQNDGPPRLDDLLAFSDGEKQENEFPQLLPRPIAFSLFTLVINKEAGVQDLSLQQIKDLYNGRYDDWQQVNGKDLPVRLVSRGAGSGTRNVFFKRIAGIGWQDPGDNSDDCEQMRAPDAPGGVVRCDRDTTGDVLNAVAGTPGALGYSELGAADDRLDDLLLVRISGHPATLEEADHGAYPFWETEYAYTYGEPSPNSLAASFLRYLTNEVGKDIVRSHGDRPCAELQNPVLCRPM